MTLGAAEVSSLRSRLTGRVVEPADSDYERSRNLYNAMIDRYPRLIVRTEHASDVRVAIEFARTHGLNLAIRGGGHSAAGLGTCDGGLVIDLSPMKGVHVDPETRLVRVGAGCTLGDMDHATGAFGLAVPSGINATTGVAGLTLGGGMGHLTRKFGLTIDNLVSADLVLADGSFVTASARSNTDLFWAIRGGGGNFGVATSFLFNAHPVPSVYAGTMFWPIEQAREVMRWYADYIRLAPLELGGFLGLHYIHPDPPIPLDLHRTHMCCIVWCYAGPGERAKPLFDDIRRQMAPRFEAMDEMPYATWQNLLGVPYPPGMQWYWRGDFVREFTADAVTAHIEHGARLPTPYSLTHFYPVNGAAHAVGHSDTAWSHRDANWLQVIAGVSHDPGDNERMIDWVNEYWTAVHPYSDGGSYVNLMMDEGSDRVRAAYGANYRALVQVKKKYDPANIFRINQNIVPE